jgi:hypothetical protein
VNNSVKITIQLTEEQMEGYPVSTESLWFDVENDLFKLKSIPFFIDNLSYDDVISVSQNSDDTYSVRAIEKKSGNSTIWLCILNDEKGKEVLEKIPNLGCGYERGVLKGYCAVNVPESVSFVRVDALIDAAIEKDILVADYPSIRHD